ncbi:replication factor C subunit 5 [Diaphorina citri]|uniref:Replication factor C subunit 5 n=1 Tax=Diaphorina citri TaxID=121845 RepID=A0A3Q0J8V6_DIACI|nr:replication factor C subunit 5 [Diaphorina citri]
MREIGINSSKYSQKRKCVWVEKYRPSTLDELVSHQDIISTINRFIDENELPHLLFYGPPGTGKTTTILACARKLYTKAQFNAMVLELNASDDRGIGIVRDQIFQFASTKTMHKSSYKLIILDEADAMTNDAQNALRRIIEKFTTNVRFCIICNYLSKIPPAIQSRCTRFRFGPLDSSLIMSRLDYVIEQEKDDISFFNIIIWVEKYRPSTLDELVSHQDIISTKIQEIKIEKGLALTDILTEISLLVHRLEIPESMLVDLVLKMSDIEYRLAAGTSEKIQLSALIAAFNSARDKLEAPPDPQ